MAIKILVVDDEPDVELIFRQKFRRRIRKGELEFFFAHDGKAALDLIQGDPHIHLVFTDLKMPIMDGLALLRALKSMDRETLFTLVISAYGDMENIRSAMNQGAFDFLTKPIDLGDLEAVIDKATFEVEKSLKSQETAEKLVVSELKREESEFLRKLQKEFFDNITHELRTPLTLLLGPVQQALDLAENEALLRLLTQAHRNGDLLLDLVNQLLDFARLDAEAMKVYPQPMDLRDTFDQLAESFRSLADSKDIDLQTIFPDRLPLLEADPKLVQRVGINLLSNALKFTPKGGQVVVAVLEASDGIAFEVRDSGIGIPQAERDQVFDRFFRSSETAAYQGTGIGLSLSKAIVELHGGDISIQDAPEGGANFKVRLPLQPPAANIGQASSPPIELEPKDSELNDSLAVPLVVLAEDNVEMRGFISQCLSGSCRILEAENGIEALELINAHLPDLIISDVMMPEMDGYQLTQQIKLQRTTSHIPIILLTAKAHARTEGLEAGAEVYLAKPFQPIELQSQIRSLLQHRESLRTHYKEEFLLRPQQSKELSMDEQFLAKIRDLIASNIDNERFDVEGLADGVAMSRRTLTRKLKALTDLAPAQMIRKFRLEKAVAMLKERSATIREIALRTGFGSSSYFTNSFKNHFGKSPREYMEEHHGQ